MKRTTHILIISGIIAGGLLMGAFLSQNDKTFREKPARSGKEEAKTIRIVNKDFAKVVKTSGRMEAFDKIELFAEVNGVLLSDSREFRPGAKFNKGEILLQINSDVQMNTLLSLRSSFLGQLTRILPNIKYDFPEEYAKWEHYLDEMEIDNKISPLPEPASDREKYFMSSQNLFKLYFDIKALEETIEKYSIEAPFDCIITAASVKPGTLVRAGQKLGALIGTGLFEMEAAVKHDEISFIKSGLSADLLSPSGGKPIKGKITRIGKSIDPASQSITIYIQSRDNSIVDGMFYNVEIRSPEPVKAAKVPISSVFNNKIRVLNNGIEKTVEAEILKIEKRDAFVTGLPDNTEIIISSFAE